MRHGMYQNKVSDHKCGLRAICRHVNKKHQQTWVGWGLEMTITLWPLKFKCVIIWLLSRRERELFSLVFPDPLTRTASIIYWATRQYVAQEMEETKLQLI